MAVASRSRVCAFRRAALALVVCAATLLVPLAVRKEANAQVPEIGGWTLVSDGDGPAARWDHTLAADEAGGRLLLFGGRDGNGDAFGDTWIFDAAEARWREVTGDGPAARFGQAVAVDQDARATYLFGGQAASTFYDDTWRFDFASEAWEQLETTAPPAARYGHSAVLDGAGNLVISHGFTFNGRFDDTWALDLGSGTWADISPAAGAARPLPRCLHEAIWNPTANRMILFGGCSSGYGPCPQGDLWAFDSSARAWTELTPSDGPSPRTNPALVFDGSTGQAILLAGSTEVGYAFDAWMLELGGEGEGASWIEQKPNGDAPVARGSHDATVLSGRIYLFGGIGDAGPLADLWTAPLRRTALE